MKRAANIAMKTLILGIATSRGNMGYCSVLSRLHFGNKAIEIVPRKIHNGLDKLTTDSNKRTPDSDKRTTNPLKARMT